MKTPYLAGLSLAFLAWAPALLAEAPVIQSGVIAADTEWETPYYIHDSGLPGPTLLLVGGVHGNEPAGYRAVEQIRFWPLTKGKIVAIPQANLRGLTEDTRYIPGASQEARDLNRNFFNPQLHELALALWEFVLTVEPDWVLDLHEGYEFRASHKPADGKKPSVGSSVIYRSSPDMDPLAERVLEAANAHVTSVDRKFVPLSRGPVSTGLAAACQRRFGAKAMILETTFKDQPLSLRTRQHRAMANVVLNHLGMIDRDCSGMLAPSGESTIEVGMFDGKGASENGLHNFARLLDAEPTMRIHHLGPSDMRPEILDQFNVVLFPGGSGSRQANDLGAPGREVVRDYVQSGGGYLGVCAGAYLCSSHYSWSLDLVNTSVYTGAQEIEGLGKKQMWFRGDAVDVEIELTEAGKELFGDIPPRPKVYYRNGPILSPGTLLDLPDYEVLAYFRSETYRYEPQKGTMIDTPAIVASTMGKGRVMAISPHPEATDGLGSIIIEAIRSLAR